MMQMHGTRSIPELLADLTELGMDVRSHRTMSGEPMVGLTEAERVTLDQRLAELEDAILQASVATNKAVALLLNASVRWRAKEEAGQDPTQEETSH